VPRKSGITVLCVSPDTAQENAVQADPKQQLHKRKKHNLPFEITG